MRALNVSEMRKSWSASVVWVTEMQRKEKKNIKEGKTYREWRAVAERSRDRISFYCSTSWHSCSFAMAFHCVHSHSFSFHENTSRSPGLFCSMCFYSFFKETERRKKFFVDFRFPLVTPHFRCEKKKWNRRVEKVQEREEEEKRE